MSYKNFMYIFLIVIFIAFVVFMATKEKFSQTTSLYSGVCAFDLDNTITCGIKNARDAINTCKKHNYKIAINTARLSKYHADIRLQDLGLSKDDYIDDFYHGEQLKCSYPDEKCFSESIASVKTKHLQTLAEKYNLARNKIILFDDMYPNITHAEANGFSVIFANNPMCGLQNNVVEQLEKIINKP